MKAQSTSVASWITLVVSGLVLSWTADAFPNFRDLIPNGRTVPHPDIPGAVWSGVGHFAVGGGGPRNPFGQDFAAATFEWTTALCEMDSDGDGRSNGVELGDPNCEWVAGVGGADPAGPAVSHPGIVDEPRTDDDLVEDTCDDYVEPEDAMNVDVRFTTANVLDGSRTQYICEQFEVDAPETATGTVFHQVKTDVLLDNPEVLHHVWVYMCDGVESGDGNKVGQGSYTCSGIESNCFIVAGWAVGAKPMCEPAHVGARLNFRYPGLASPTSKQIFKIEAHYDNALGLSGAVDQSGMRLTLTQQLRPVESGVVVLGMDFWDRQFELPAGREQVALSNICPATATQRLPHPVWVYSWNPHMHLFGQSLVTEHYRCGRKIGEIGRISHFEFDNQQTYLLPQPIKILPGDALVTTCVFNTSTTNSTITGGDETTDEMCDNYLTFFPSVETLLEPTLFSACASFAQGILPRYVGYDDSSSFATLDLGGSIYVENYEADPALNLADCCGTNGDDSSCEYLHRSQAGSPCVADSDCVDGLNCDANICSGDISSGAPCWWSWWC